MAVHEPATGVATGVRRDGADVTVSYAGEFDLSCADTLYRVGLAQLQPGLGTLILDLSEVTLLDSVSVWALLRLHRAADEAGVPVRLVVRHRLVRLVVELSGLSEHLAVTVAA